jgi:uncharacterized membrane protein YqjE
MTVTTVHNVEKTDPSIGELVQNASTQFSTILHGEIELAKYELKSSVKNAGTGVVFFVAAAVLIIFSLTFGLIAFAEGLIALHLWRWAAYLIVFGTILLLALFLAYLGYRKVKKVRAPERTIATSKDTAAFLRHPTQQA